MGYDNIDASLGLEFSLNLFRHYRKNGIVQAKIRSVPGVQGLCMAYLHLVDGVVIACFVEDKHGQRKPVTAEVLCRVDNEKGPFEWVFHSQATASPSMMLPPSSGQSSHIPWSPAAQSAQSVSPQNPVSQMPDLSVPIIISSLDWERLDSWTYQQKQMLYAVLKMIDGRRTIQDIKASVALPASIVSEALQSLISLGIITISS